MAGRGQVPKAEARTRHTPLRGTWRPAPGIGWQHGPIPDPPPGLLGPSLDAWRTWMGAWFAAHWTPGDVPVLRLLIRTFDMVERGEASGAVRTELRHLMDNYGITPRGQQDRRWTPPKEDEKRPTAGESEHYAHLRVVDAGKG